MYLTLDIGAQHPYRNCKATSENPGLIRGRSRLLKIFMCFAMSQRPDFRVPWINANYALDLADSDVNCWINGVLAGGFYNGVFQGGVHRYQAPFVLMLKQMLDQNYQGISKKVFTISKSDFPNNCPMHGEQYSLSNNMHQSMLGQNHPRIRLFFFFLEGGGC